MPEYLLLLECGHLRVDPKKSTIAVICPRCSQIRPIVKRTAGYSWKCYTCKARGNYGLALFNCETAMYRHRRKNYSHKCAVLLGKTVIRMTGHEESSALEFTEEPPF